MINIGDTVKIVKMTQKAGGEPGELFEYIRIGTICTVNDIDHFDDGTTAYECIPDDWRDDIGGFWYLEDEIEKGHLEWIKDE